MTLMVWISQMISLLTSSCFAKSNTSWAKEDEDEEYDEEYEEDDMMEMPSGKDVKVKVLKLDGSNVHEMMNKILGG
jgi:hypothetical protein